MIRKVYLDFMRQKAKSFDLGWFLARGLQYSLTHMSFMLGRALCGPVLGTIATNYRCNLGCKMCSLPSRDSELRARGLRELGTSEMKALVREFRGLGTSGIGFTGGEPLLRKDVFEILAYTKSLGIITHLNTNGLLIDEDTARKIIDSGVDSLNISLDGARPSTHDAIRQCAGAFERATGAIRLIDEMRRAMRSALRLKTVCVLDETNLDELQDIIKLAAGMGVDCVEFIPVQGFKEGFKVPDYKADFFVRLHEEVGLLRKGPHPVKVENSDAHLRLLENSFRGEPSPLSCYAGYNSLAVDSYGEVYPCVPWMNWGMGVGNIGDMGLGKYWRSSIYNKMRREIRSCRRCYLNCQAELNILFRPPLRI